MGGILIQQLFLSLIFVLAPLQPLYFQNLHLLLVLQNSRVGRLRFLTENLQPLEKKECARVLPQPNRTSHNGQPLSLGNPHRGEYKPSQDLFFVINGQPRLDARVLQVGMNLIDGILGRFVHKLSLLSVNFLTNTYRQLDGKYLLVRYDYFHRVVAEGLFGVQNDYQSHGALVHLYCFVRKDSCLGL